MMTGEYKNLMEWSADVISALGDLHERITDMHCRALAIEDILVKAGHTSREHFAALLEAKCAAANAGWVDAAAADEAPPPREPADAPKTRDDYAKRFLRHMFARTLPGGDERNWLVYWAHVKEAVNNPALFPAPVVQGVDPEALRALPRRLVISGSLSLCNSEHGDIVFWRDIQALIDALPAEPQPESPPECQGDSHRWVSYLTCYADRGGVFRRRICPVCKKDEAAPPNSDQAKPGVICWPLDVATPNEPGKPEPEPSAEAECEHDWQVTYKSLRWHPEHPWHRLTCVKCWASRRVAGDPAKPMNVDEPADAGESVADVSAPAASSRAPQHPADVLADLAERSGHEVDPETLAAFRAACDKPVAGTRACHPAGHDWVKFEGLDPSHPNAKLRICQRCGLRLDSEGSARFGKCDEGVPVLHCFNCGQDELAPRFRFVLPDGAIDLYRCGHCGVKQWRD